MFRGGGRLAPVTAGHTIAFLLFALVAAITPGPSNLILASTGAAVGVVRGLPALFGQVVGMGVMLFLVAFGLGSLVLKNPFIVLGLKWCGVAFLLWLAWRITRSGRPDETEEQIHVGFRGVAAFQWVNPKAWLVCAAAVGAYSRAETANALGWSVTLALLFILAALPSCLVWLAAGAGMQRFLRTGQAFRIFNVAMALLLAGSILLFIR
jgi:threonine/homoserine/homoserine lactone efflux protein